MGREQKREGGREVRGRKLPSPPPPSSASFAFLLSSQFPRGQTGKNDMETLATQASPNQDQETPGRGGEQTDGVAMGSPLGPLLANVFVCSIEEILEQHGQLPRYYRRYVDDTLTVMPDRVTTGQFLDTLNSTHQVYHGSRTGRIPSLSRN